MAFKTFPQIGANWKLFNTGGTSLTAATTITVSNIPSSVRGIMVYLASASSANNGSTISIRVNGITSSSYTVAGAVDNKDGSNSDITYFDGAQDKIPLAKPQNASEACSGYCLILDTNGTGLKAVTAVGASSALTLYAQNFWVGGVIDTSGAPISSVSVVSSTGNFDAGTVYVYVAE